MRANIRDCKGWCIVTVGCVSFRGVGDESWLRVFDGGAKEKTKEKERERERVENTSEYKPQIPRDRGVTTLLLHHPTPTVIIAAAPGKENRG